MAQNVKPRGATQLATRPSAAVAAPAIHGPDLSKLSFPDMMQDRRVQTQIQRILPKNLTVEKMLQVGMILFRTSWGLKDCVPMSILSAMVETAQLGFELDKTRGQAYLVPFKKECTFICGYKGYITLAMRTADVDAVWGDVVRVGDDYQELGGSLHQLHHEKKGESENEADWTHVYACVRRAGTGYVDFEALSRDRVFQYRARSASWRAYTADHTKKSPWADPLDRIAMWKKTAIRQLMKRTDLSVVDQRQSPQLVAAREELREKGLLRRSPELSDVGTDREFSVLEEPVRDELAPAERVSDGKGQTYEVRGGMIEESFLPEDENENGAAKATATDTTRPAVAPTDAKATGAARGTAGSTAGLFGDPKNESASKPTPPKRYTPSGPKISLTQADDLLKAAAEVSSDKEAQSFVLKIAKKRGFKDTMDIRTNAYDQILKEVQDGGWRD
jgi:recombination protein RecT